jgi:uncharacterized protein YjiS (DUF1127 family)
MRARNALRQGSHAFAALHKRALRAYIPRIRERAHPERMRQSGSKKMSRNTHSMFDRFRRWRRYRQTVRELQGLSTRELTDLGIGRGDIGRVAREASHL